jgi:hypothetical protein
MEDHSSSSSPDTTDETDEERREAARRLGQARTPAKAAAARENGKKGGSNPDDFTDERRRRMSAGMRAFWERRRAEGRTTNAGAHRARRQASVGDSLHLRRRDRDQPPITRAPAMRACDSARE